MNEQKVYSGADDPDLPDYIQELPEKWREQWVSIFNSAFAACREKGGERDLCEEKAFRIANGVLKRERRKEEKEKEKIAGQETIARIIAAQGVKFLDRDETRIGGYLVRWGDDQNRDLHGEYFAPDTDFRLEWFKSRPLLYHHGIDETIGAEMIGEIDTVRRDKVGLWVEAQLRRAGDYWAGVRELIKQGLVGWSSGTVPHLATTLPDGKIASWPLIEGSLTVTPADPRSVGDVKYKIVDCGLLYNVDVNSTARAMKAANIAVPASLQELLGVIEDGATEAKAETAAVVEFSEPIVIYAGEQDMDTGVKNAPPAADLRSAVKEVLGEIAEEQRIKTLETRYKETQAELERVKAELARKEAETETGARRLPGRTDEQEARPEEHRPEIRVKSKYDDIPVVDLAFAYSLLRASREFKGVSDEFMNALREKAIAGGYVKSDELVYSTQSGYGDEWVPDLWSAELWREARLENVILPLFRVVEMPSNPYELPLEGTDPTVYYVAETADETDLTLAGSGSAIPDSKVGTGKVQLAAKKLALRVGVSAEMQEDSIIPAIALFREQAVRAMADTIDALLLNGDTETGSTGNVNSDDGAPTAGTYYLALDGLRKLGLVTTTANKINAAGAPTLTAMRQTRFTMAYKYSVNPRNLAWIVDGGTYGALLNLPEFVTMDKAGAAATAMTGQIGMVDGAPVLVSAAMPLTEADGKCSATASNNTKGQAVVVYRPGWIVGYRRRIAAAIEYLSYYDAYQLTATVRVAFGRRDADVAAVLYNITV